MKSSIATEYRCDQVPRTRIGQNYGITSARPASATSSSRARWIARWPSTFTQYSPSEWLPKPMPPRLIVTAGTPSAMGTFESVDERPNRPSTPKTAVVARARWMSGALRSPSPDGRSPIFSFFQG